MCQEETTEMRINKILGEFWADARESCGCNESRDKAIAKVIRKLKVFICGKE